MIRITDHNYGTFEERLERFKSWSDHLPKYFKRGVVYDKSKNVLAVRTRDADTKNEMKEWFLTKNIVTVDGNKYYAEKAANTSPMTIDFSDTNNRCELQNPVSSPSTANTNVYSDVSSPITASRKALTATYPKVSDGDADNLGGGATVVSWDYSWITTDFNTASANNIYGGCIHDAGGTPIAGSKLLNHWAFGTSFEKLATDKLKVFVNHTLLGV